MVKLLLRVVTVGVPMACATPLLNVAATARLIIVFFIAALLILAIQQVSTVVAHSAFPL
jgi:hypothetical protein